MLRRRRIATTFVGLVFHIVILPGRIGLTPEVQAIFQQLQRQLQLQLLVQRPACTKQVGCLLVFSLCHSDCIDLDLDLEFPKKKTFFFALGSSSLYLHADIISALEISSKF